MNHHFVPNVRPVQVPFAMHPNPAAAAAAEMAAAYGMLQSNVICSSVSSACPLTPHSFS